MESAATSTYRSFFTLNIQLRVSPDMVINFCPTTRRHIPDESNLYIYDREKFKS
jgi:hypothetical protein